MHLQLAQNILVCVYIGCERFSVLKLLQLRSQLGRELGEVSPFRIRVAACSDTEGSIYTTR